MAKLLGRFSFLWLVLFISTNVTAVAAKGLDVANIASGYNFTALLTYLEDPKGRWDIDTVQTKDWQNMDPDQLTFGYTHSTYWFKVSFDNASADDIQRFIGIHYPVLDYVDVYRRVNGGEWSLEKFGDKYPFSQREIDNRNFILSASFAAHSTVEYVFRVETSSSMQFPVRIWNERDFFEHDQTQMLAMGLYYGIMLVMVFYNFFVFFSIKERNYLYYVCYVACMALFLSSLQGLSFQYLWPEATQWNDKSIIVFLAGAILFGIFFTRNFLHINKIFFVNFILSFFGGILVLILVFINTLNYHVLIQIIIVVAFVCLNLAFAAGVVRWFQGYATARYYTIAWFSILFGGIILALNKFNIIPRNLFTENIVQLGSAAEVILLSFALADRLNREKRKRYQVQIYALEQERQARQAQQDKLATQQQANETLELRVKERTLELEEANKQLELMSITDALTNIRNRRYFDQTLKYEMARAIREQEPISVLIIDIDYFKNVNDTYGHQVGDEVLKAVASKLSQLISRSTDLLARFGGEEFVVILPNTTIEGAAHVAECIRTAMDELTFEGAAKDLKIKVSVGVYGDIPTGNSNHEHWVRYADEALYQAKENGRDQVIIFRGA